MSRTKAVAFCLTISGLVGVLAFRSGYSVAAQNEASRVYELRTYTTHPGRLPALNARFRDHTMRIFEKHGIRNVMYWVPTDEAHKENTLIYIISHASLEAAQKSWRSFIDDPEWQKVRDASEKDGKIVEKVESVYMTPTDYSPRPAFDRPQKKSAQ